MMVKMVKMVRERGRGERERESERGEDGAHYVLTTSLAARAFGVCSKIPWCIDETDV